MIQPKARLVGVALFSTILVACSNDPGNPGAAAETREVVVVYTSMEESRTAPLFRAFEKTTGTRVQTVSADNPKLLEMLRDKRYAPAADLYVAAGAAILSQAVRQGVFRPIYTETLDALVPSRLRDPENQWFGIALSANVLVINASLSAADEPDVYESLADEKWRGRLCLSSSTLPENIALIAWLIERHGKRDAELIIRHMLANLAMPVFKDAASLLSAVGAGECDAGIARLDMAQAPGGAASLTRIVLPAAANGGIQVDLVGAGVTRHAGNPDGAQKLLLWLAGEAGQRLIADSKIGLPISPSVGMPPQPSASGALEQSKVDVYRLAEFSEDAVDLAERARYR